MTAKERELVEQAAPHAETNGASPPENGAVRPQCGPGVPLFAEAPLEDAFRRLNRRRHELIQRKVHGSGLTTDEEAELQRLDAQVDAFVETNFPKPIVDWDRLEALAEKLGHEFKRPEGF